MVRIMIVDDERQILKALERTLRPSGYEITSVNDPEEAIKHMTDGDWDIIMADYRMPVVNGLSVLKAAKESVPQALRILMTGYTDIEVIIQAINEGSIYKYVSKPWDNDALLQLISEAVAHKHQIDENNKLIKTILNENSEWSGITKSLEHKIMQLSEQGVQALLKTIQAKDQALYAHSLKVAWVAKRVGLSMDLRQGDLQTLRLAALFHDIGKIAIRDSVLFKEGKLEPDERAQMIHHSVIGAEIIKEMDFMKEVAEVVLQHHERHDGKGYPRGLIGSNIKILARVLCASDIYVALREERPYKSAIASEDALKIIKSESGKILDELIVEKFCKAFKSIDLPANIFEEDI